MDKQTILIVDDNSKNIQIVANILKKEGFKVNFARSGKQVLKNIKTNYCDLILLDIMMPEMNGFEVCEQLKQIPLIKDIPVIFVTAKDDIESIKKGFEIGGVDYITKPFIEEELVARVNSVLFYTKYHKYTITQKNKELTENSLYLVQNNEFLTQMIKKLRNLTNNIDDKELVLKICENLTEAIESKVKEDLGKHFDIYFQKVHQNFRKTLSTQFPELSNTDLKLCAFLRLGMSSKEISAITYKTVGSIKVMRYRIRKKVNIPKSSSLTSFLAQY